MARKKAERITIKNRGKTYTNALKFNIHSLPFEYGKVIVQPSGFSKDQAEKDTIYYMNKINKMKVDEAVEFIKSYVKNKFFETGPFY